MPATSKIYAYRILAALFALGLWEGLVVANILDRTFVSQPTSIAVRLYSSIVDGTVFSDSWVTIYEAAIGWMLGSVVGIIIGLTTASWKTLDLTVAPFVDALNAAPRLALASLFIVWFGIGSASKIALVFSVVVIIVLIASNNAAKSVDGDYVTLLRAMGASRMHLFLKVVIPWCVPSIMSGLRISIAYALTGAVVGEMLVSQQGIGNTISRSAAVLDTTGLLAGVIVIMVIAYAASLALSTIEDHLLRWRPDVL
jgi:NitT/TauT family transport system permease protein